MTLAIVLVAFAVIALVFILRISISRALQISNSGSTRIEPIDIDAFRNLIDPAESDYLYRRLPGPAFRHVQRGRLLAAAAYIRVAARNASTLILIGQSALAAHDARTTDAARQLIDGALLLRRNATLALLRIYVAVVWPQTGLSVIPVLSGYERLSSNAMLLGRLQNPAVPVRISARP